MPVMYVERLIPDITILAGILNCDLAFPTWVVASPLKDFRTQSPGPCVKEMSSCFSLMFIRLLP